jgi:hypothetical protein
VGASDKEVYDRGNSASGDATELGEIWFPITDARSSIAGCRPLRADCRPSGISGE